jgi:hypothetical protein
MGKSTWCIVLLALTSLTLAYGEGAEDNLLAWVAEKGGQVNALRMPLMHPGNASLMGTQMMRGSGERESWAE